MQVAAYMDALVAAERSLTRREAELVDRLRDLEQAAAGSDPPVSLDHAKPPPGLAPRSRQQPTEDDRKLKLASTLMELEALDGLRKSSAVYDLALSSKASQALHSQVHDESRVARLEKQSQQLRRQLGVDERWARGHEEFDRYVVEVVKVRACMTGQTPHDCSDKTGLKVVQRSCFRTVVFVWRGGRPLVFD
jgi:hypothetical protein